MINVEKNKKYYMYSKKNGYSLEFKSFENLIEYVRKENHRSYDYKILSNRYLEDISLNFKDIRCYSFGDNVKYTYREYIFYDEDYRIIDLRLYENLIITEYDKKVAKENSDIPYYICSYNIRKKEIRDKGYIFRKTPVPHTGCGRGRWQYKPNRTKYLKEIKDNIYVEDKYVRKKRMAKLIEYQDSRNNYSKTPRCWKDQSKKRKQWL